CAAWDESLSGYIF
nr:immunoglobulin light chain junction region [Macaca mulatta]MPO03599.1 immunoglobulin light chain junction region [Macaca mulatta]MPO04585.1 immunoglobulin light chain junction region [Macaca mulatta]MPO04614.1 immunoglobulin light chain junction region [Macaca mulatta]MPO04897.1 immunoglobulin light chain junction region [Macaca mulatta]